MSSSEMLNLNHKGLIFNRPLGAKKPSVVPLNEWVFENEGSSMDVIVAVFSEFPAMTIQMSEKGNVAALCDRINSSGHSAVVLAQFPSSHGILARERLLRDWSAVAHLAGAVVRNMEVNTLQDLAENRIFLERAIENIGNWPFEMHVLTGEAERTLVRPLYEFATGESKQHIEAHMNGNSPAAQTTSKPPQTNPVIFVKESPEMQTTSIDTADSIPETIPETIDETQDADSQSGKSTFKRGERRSFKGRKVSTDSVLEVIEPCDHEQIKASPLLKTPFTQSMRGEGQWTVYLGVNHDWTPGCKNPMIKIGASSVQKKYRGEQWVLLNIQKPGAPEPSHIVRAAKSAAACFGLSYGDKDGGDSYTYDSYHNYMGIRNHFQLVLDIIDVFPIEVLEQVKPFARYRAYLAYYTDGHPETQKMLEAALAAAETVEEVEATSLDNVVASSLDEITTEELLVQATVPETNVATVFTVKHPPIYAVDQTQSVLDLGIAAAVIDNTSPVISGLRVALDYAESEIFKLTQDLSIRRLRVEELEDLVRKIQQERAQISEIESQIAENKVLRTSTEAALKKLTSNQS